MKNWREMRFDEFFLDRPDRHGATTSFIGLVED